MSNKAYITYPLMLLFCFHADANDEGKLDHFLSLSLEELMELEITISTDTKLAVAKAPATVTVITEEDIKATGSTNLAEVLETVPGIHVRASQFGFRPLVHFRGATANQTLLMVNGVSMRDLMWGYGFFWKGLPTSSIRRIEVIRGPGSALFGADASAGVINVITKTAGSIDSSEFGVRRGSFDTSSGWMQHGTKWNGFEFGLTMDFHETDGHDPMIKSDSQTAQDATDGTAASLAPDHAQYGWRSDEVRIYATKGDWRMNLDYADHTDIETGLTGSGILDPVTKASDKRWNADIFYNNDHLLSDWNIEAEVRYQDYSYSSGNGFQEYPPGAKSDDNSTGLINQMRSSERRLSFETSGLFTGLSSHSIRIGTGYNWQDLYDVKQYKNYETAPDGTIIPSEYGLIDFSDTPSAFAPEKKRKIRYLFLQDIWQFANNWELTTGARYDHYSDFGSTFNPRLVLVWETSTSLTSKLLYGRAFRPPSYQELYSTTSNALPNSELKPERSETLELAFSYILNPDINLGFNIFQYEQTDFIDDALIPGEANKKFINVGKHTIRGVELEMKWQLADNLRVSGNYTIRDENDNEFRAVDEPKQDAYLRTDWSFLPKWNWNIQLNWIGERTRKESDTRSTLDDYLITDTTLRFTTTKNWEFATSIRNLFDEDAYEYSGSVPGDLPLPERNFYAEIIYKLD